MEILNKDLNQETNPMLVNGSRSFAIENLPDLKKVVLSLKSELPNKIAILGF